MRRLICRTALASLPLFALAAPGIALGESLKEGIVGTWRLASIYNEENGVKRHVYGENPVGLFISIVPDTSASFSRSRTCRSSRSRIG